MTTMAAPQTVRYCRCDRRYAAQRAGQIVLDPAHGCWYFPDDPPRRVFNSWRSEWYGTESHDGEPFRYEICPFCGGDLPMVDLEPPYESSSGATDGGDE